MPAYCTGAGATVTVPGAQVVVTVFTTRRIFFGAACAIFTGLRLTILAFAWRTTAPRGFSATCTAPPPISAPPTAQADSFAKAIRTDIARYSYCVSSTVPSGVRKKGSLPL